MAKSHPKKTSLGAEPLGRYHWTDKKLFDQARTIARKGRAIYQTVRPELEKVHWGKHVRIDIGTGQYVVGGYPLDSYKLFRAKFGDNPGWGTGIGVPIRV